MKKNSHSRACNHVPYFLSAFVFCCLVSSLCAQSKPSDTEPPAPTSNGAADDVDRELFGEKKGEKKLDAPQGDAEEMQERLRRELGEAAVEKESGNPVLDIARRMQSVQTRIAGADVGEQVQNEQKQIIADLDKLIEQAKKSCKKSGSCSSAKQCSSRTPSNAAAKPSTPKPGGKANDKPAEQSTQRSAEKKTVKPDPAEMRNLIKDLWGELPQNVREQMMQNPTEQFVPQYETMIEDYYRRLGEKKE